MTEFESKEIKETLANPDLHEKWESTYRKGMNVGFYEEVCDYIVSFLSPPKDALVLDAGCGSGVKSLLLAKRGFIVNGVDFSEIPLRKARENVKLARLQDKITFESADILSLPFTENRFDYVLCWGVLMHIPDVNEAINELYRVLKPGGFLIVSEGNMYSLQAIIFRALERFLKKEKTEKRCTEAGLEYRTKTSAGVLFIRHANIRALIKIFERSGFTLQRRVAGQFTELYRRFSSPKMTRLIHAFNHVWFKYVKMPYPALGNILFLEKVTR